MNQDYPEYILQKLRQRQDLDEDDTSMDETFQDMQPDQVFKECLEWEGICGYTSTILGWIADIYGIYLKGSHAVYDRSDKRRFVKGFGNFMRYNTGDRTEIHSMTLQKEGPELVDIRYTGGHGRTVNIGLDSEIATIRDIMKNEG